MGTCDQQADVGRRSDIRGVESRIAAADVDAVDGCAVGRNLHAAGDNAFSSARAMSIQPEIGAVEGHGLIEIHLLAVRAGCDQDRVPGRSRVNRGLDGGVAAVADQKDVVASAVRDPLDAVEKIGPLGSRTHLPAGLVAGRDRIGISNRRNVRCRQRAGVERRVSPRTAEDGVVAGAADDAVVAGPGSQGVVAVLATGVASHKT
jgi:hypothetical protein